jgi:hypothetical protein
MYVFLFWFIFVQKNNMRSRNLEKPVALEINDNEGTDRSEHKPLDFLQPSC